MRPTSRARRATSVRDDPAQQRAPGDAGHDSSIYGAVAGIEKLKTARELAIDLATLSSHALAARVAAMHSFWQRLNAIFFYTLSVLGFLAFAAAGTTYWHAADPKISVSLKKLML